MKKCPHCGEEIQEGATVCALCHSDMTAAPTPGEPVQARISKKAIASLILGIFSAPYFFPGILGVIFGHMSRSEIRKSGGRLKGADIALAGLILGYGGLFVFINIDNLMKSWHAQKNAYAVGSLRTLNIAAGTYAAAHGGGYPTSLAALLPPANQSHDAQEARTEIDRALTSGWMPGRVFTYVPSDIDEKGIPKSYSIQAEPVEGKIMRLYFGLQGPYTGSYYFTDQTGVIRYEYGKPADKNSSPLAG